MTEDKKQALIDIYSNLPDEEEIKDKLDQFYETYGQFNQLVEKMEFNKLTECYSKLYYTNSNEPRKQDVVKILKYIADEYFNLEKGHLYRRRLWDLGLVEDLIEKSYKKGIWSFEFYDYFKKGINMLKSWKIFFFSYTKEGDDLINKAFINLHNVKKKSHIDENYLATEIVKRLSYRFDWNINPDVDYFYNLESMKSGDDWKEKCLISCQTSFVLIQLIHHGIFKKNPDENYAFIEYDEFTKLNDRQRCHFITANIEKIYLEAGDPLPEYKLWKNTICDLQRYELKSQSKITSGELDRIVIDPLIKEIRHTIKEVIYSYLVNESNE